PGAHSTVRTRVACVESRLVSCGAWIFVGLLRALCPGNPAVCAERAPDRCHLAGCPAGIRLFPILTRLPEHWKPAWRWSTRFAGWTGAILFLAMARYPNGQGFALGRSDII